MSVGFYPGSFDPFTYGHLHVVVQSIKLFDHVIIGIGVHPQKNRRFDTEIMKKAIEQVIINENLSGKVSVISYENFSADVAFENNTQFLIRGIRNGMDYEYEENMASINEEISGLDTIYIRAGKLGNISSSMVMELLRNGKDVSKYLPKEIMKII